MYWVMVESNTPQKIAIDPSMRYSVPLIVTPSGRLYDIGVDNSKTLLLWNKTVKQLSLPTILYALLIQEFHHSFLKSLYLF